MAEQIKFVACNPQQLSFVNTADLSRLMPSCQMPFSNPSVNAVFRRAEDDEDCGSLSTLQTASLNSRASGPVVMSTTAAAGVQGRLLKFPGVCQIVKNELAPPPPQPTQATSSTSSTSAAAKKDSALDPRKYKTHLCRNWLRTGVCAFAEGCVYAHGSQELRKESENISVLSLLEKLASQSNPPSGQEAPAASMTTIDTSQQISRRKARKQARRAKAKANQPTSKLELVKIEDLPHDDGEEVVFDLPLNGAVHIETDDDEGSDSELVPSPNKNDLSGDFAAMAMNHDLRKAASFPVNEVEGRRAANEQWPTSHSFQPFTTQRVGISMSPQEAALALAAAAAAGVNPPTSTTAVSPPRHHSPPSLTTTTKADGTEVELQKLKLLVKDSAGRIQNLENEVALLKSCLAELLKNCEEKSRSSCTSSEGPCSLNTTSFTSSFNPCAAKTAAAMSNSSSLPFFNFHPTMGNNNS